MEVTQLEQFEDPGATALDDLDGALPVQTNLTAGALDTTHPTPEGGPHVVMYTARDAAGNAAEPVFREVTALPPPRP